MILSISLLYRHPNRVILILAMIVAMVIVTAYSLDTNNVFVFDPYSDTKVMRWDGFTFGLAFSSKESFFSKQIQLSPCDSRLSLHGTNAQFAVLIRQKLVDIWLHLPEDNMQQRSMPTLVADKSNIITSFTLVLEFIEGRLVNLYWKKFGCKSCAERSAGICVNNEVCATPVSKCKANGGSADCSISVQLAF